MKTLWARFCSDDGAEFVEFALAFPLLLVVMLGIMDMGIMFQQYQVIAAAAREGARVGVLPSYATTDAETRALAYINASAATIGGGSPTATATIQANVPVGTKCMSTITVATSYRHTFLFVGSILRYFGSGTLGTKTMNATATMRLEQTVGTCP